MLGLGSNNFTGKISINFGGLKKITEVDLFENNYGTGDPDELSFISSMVNCNNLRILDIGDNTLRWVLPKSIGNLSTELFYLVLGGNPIYGDLPSTIGNFVNLTLLGLFDNQFTGTIPTTVGNLQKLQRMALQGNNLLGKIPNSI